MAILVAVVLALVPLLIAPGFVFYFDVTPKLVVLLAGTTVALPWLARQRAAWRALLSVGAARWFCVLVAAQVLSLALATFWSAHPALSFSGSNWRRLGLVSQVAILLFALGTAVSLAANRSGMRIVLRVSAASGAAVGLYGIAQYFGWDPILPRGAYHAGEGVWTIVRPPSTLGHANYFATYLLHVVFAGAALALMEEARAWRLLGIAACALGSLGAVVSGTRGAMLGLAVGLAWIAIWFRPRLTHRDLAIAAAIMVAAAAFYVSPPGLKLRARMHWSLEDPRGGARLWLWRDSLRMASSRWATGYGPETFSSQFPQFQSLALSRAYPDFYHESPHNVFLDVLTAQGAPGLLVTAALAVVALFAAFRARASNRLLAGALSAGFAASLVAHQFACFTVPTALFFYANAALLVALAAKPVAGAENTPPEPLWLVAAAVSAGLVTFAVCLLESDRSLERVRLHLDAGNIGQAIAEYHRGRRWQPPGVSTEVWYSRRLVDAAQKSPYLGDRLRAWREAIDAAVRATSASEDRHNAWYNLASLYGAQNDFAATEASLRTAILWAPKWFKPHWTLAQVLCLRGRLNEAETEAAVAAELNGGKHPEVAQTLADIRSLLNTPQPATGP